MTVERLWFLVEELLEGDRLFVFQEDRKGMMLRRETEKKYKKARRDEIEKVDVEDIYGRQRQMMSKREEDMK